MTKFTSISYWATDPKTHEFIWVISALRTLDSDFAHKTFDSVAWNTLHPEITLIEMTDPISHTVRRKFRNPQVEYDLTHSSSIIKYFDWVAQNV